MKLFLWIGLVLGFNGLITVSLPQAIRKCGLEPDLKREVDLGARGALQIPKLDLLRIDVENQGTVLWIIVNATGKDRKFYRSLDGGTTWRPYLGTLGNLTNLPRVLDTEKLGLVISGPIPVAYEFNGCEVRESRDGGNIWQSKIAAPKHGQEFVTCTPINIGKKTGRVYLWSWGKPDKGLWCSDDFGLNYQFLTTAVGYISESAADPERIYGVATTVLRRSDDGGKNWTDLDNSRFMFRPVYIGKDGVYRTWDENGSGEELGYPACIEQIQTDPKNKNIIYVLTIKGLYRSIDGGESFILLGLEADKVLNIDRIACDPLEGRYVYAVVGRDSLYRSNDWGCTWQKLKIPEQTSKTELGDGDRGRTQCR